jgi:hypothetical protein
VIDPVVEDEPVDDAADEYSFEELGFGQALPVSGEKDDEALVTIGKPVLATCQYKFTSCDQPKIGDRIVEVEIVIENTGSVPSSWSRSYFVLEFADGTQVETSDGSAIDYSPDNHMDYDVKVRPNSTFRSVLVFEAPKGPFSILILTNPYDGEPFASWS